MFSTKRTLSGRTRKFFLIEFGTKFEIKKHLFGRRVMFFTKIWNNHFGKHLDPPRPFTFFGMGLSLERMWIRMSLSLEYFMKWINLHQPGWPFSACPLMSNRHYRYAI